VRMLRLMAGRLDAAQSPAEFFDLAFIGEFLALGYFHQLKNFVQLIDRVFQRFRDFRGVGHGLADGRSVGGAEIGRAAPLPLFGAALLPVLGRLLAALTLWRRFRRMGR